MVDDDPHGSTQSRPGDAVEPNAEMAPAAPDVEPVAHVERTGRCCIRLMARAAGLRGVRWGSGLLVTLVIGITIQQIISSSPQRRLRAGIETAAAAMSTARGILVPGAIVDLNEFPREMVLTELRTQFTTADEPRKLPLALLLAHFGDVRVDYLVSRIETASPDGVDRFVSVLSTSTAWAVAALEAAARTAERQKNWRHKARLAMLALHLHAPALAQDMCHAAPDPIPRTLFIDECASWHGNLSMLAERLAASDEGLVRSGVALAVGSVPVENVTVADKREWELLLATWYKSKGDTSTHSAAWWALRQWNLQPPEIATSQEPAGERNWHVNSVNMTMLKIPAGSFTRTYNGAGYYTIEQNVTLTRSFLLADCEVTRSQFRQFINDPDCPDSEKPKYWWGIASKRGRTEQHPIQSVNWYDAVLFCNWLSRQEGLMPCYERTGEKEKETTRKREYDVWRLIPDVNGYRLPTDAEWEYACRAGTATLFSHGNDESLLDRYAVFGATRLPGTQVAGSKLPNAWGLFDLHGNVCEWCQDRYDEWWRDWYETRGGQETVTDPMGSGQGPDERVLRGGSFFYDARHARSTLRRSWFPGLRYTVQGFRVARTYP